MNPIHLTDEQKEALGIKDERKDFYFKVENEAIDNPEIFGTDREFILFIVLSRYCNNNQIAYPSLETLAKKSRCSKRNLIKALNGLVAKGLIKKVQRYDKEAKTYQSNLYAVQTIKEYIAKDRSNKCLNEVVTPATLGGSDASDTRGSDVSDTRVVTPATPKKEQVIKNNYKKNHDHDNELDFFENLFKEFGINFTTTNKNSVLRLRKNLSLKDVEAYLRETYQAIIENKDVVNVPALFSSKIAKGERQINSSPKSKKKSIENEDPKSKEVVKNEDLKSKEVVKNEDLKSKEVVKNEDLKSIENEKIIKFNSLSKKEQIEIENKALKLIAQEENIPESFLIETKRKSPTIYNGMIRQYLAKVL